MRQTIVVSGANGWLGESAVSYLSNNFLDCRIIALVRNTNHLNLYKNTEYMTYNEFNSSGIQAQGFVHTAFKTQNYVQDMGVNNYSQENNEILIWVKSFLDSQKLSWAVTVSSGAASIYQEKLKNKEPLSKLDLYGKLKLEEENIFLQSNIKHIAVGRLWAASGKFMKNFRVYALGQFIYSGIHGEDIILQSREAIYRRYTDAEVFMEVLIRCAIENDRKLFNSGGVLISLSDLANEVAQYFSNLNKSTIQVKVSENDFSAPNPNYYSSDNSFLDLERLFSVPQISILNQIRNTELAIRKQINPGNFIK